MIRECRASILEELLAMEDGDRGCGGGGVSFFADSSPDGRV